MKKKNRQEIDWIDSIDNDISIEDQLKHKEFAKQSIKAKKIKKILFWTFTSAALTTIIGATIGIQLSKPKNALIYWYDKIQKYSFSEILLNNNKKEYPIKLTINKNKKIPNQTPEGLLEYLVNNKIETNKNLIFGSKETEGYAKLEFLNKDKNWYIEFENFVIDTISKDILIVDLVFKEKGNSEIDFVIRNFPIRTEKETEKYNLESLDQTKKNNTIKNSKAIIDEIKSKIAYSFYSPIDLKGNYPQEKINSYKNILKQYIEEFNQLYNLNNQDLKFYQRLDISRLFSEPFSHLIKVNEDLGSLRIYSNAAIETSNFFSPLIFNSKIELKNIDTDNWQEETHLKFKAKIVTLGTETKKIGRKKIQYGIYIEATNNEQKEIEFDIPLRFKKTSK
ncbi:hypothetical protein [Metamycoplasma auris]|uniref:Uncharacterized protein n=1 Tax=Metamycoplasma auris TaxID=51363 RepID=A0A2W7HU52_9BACT|nr:hypothetical protein [Metamycoplasma auris]PZV98725.1 hypothetical protein BCF89_1125 [Metamycoplasma auris]